jgi:hypothetical protein
MNLPDRDSLRRSARILRSAGSGSGPQKWLMIAAVAIPLAIAGWHWYQKLDRNRAPREGALIVNVNTATQQELETIPGVGPALAREIIRGRPYDKIEDLERVRGIGSYTMNAMRPYVRTEGDTDKR